MATAPAPLITARPQFALFEDNLTSPARATLLHGACEHLRCAWPDDAVTTLDRIEAWRAQGRHVAFAGQFELGYALEPRLHHLLSDGTLLFEAWAFDTRTTLADDALEAWWAEQLASLSPQAREAGILSLTPAMDGAAHGRRVERILDYIRTGDCYQVNLTFPWHGEVFGSPIALFHVLRARQPVSYGVLIRDDDRWVLSRSPELFVAQHGERVVCKPMKGTATRGTDPVEDHARAVMLLASPKNQAENLMIVDLIRNDLGRLAPPGGVSVLQLFELETYPTVFQLTSTVTAEPVRASLGALLQALFPCGSVTGAPKIRAEEIIDELEIAPRGLYCGALGHLSAHGDISLNVPIRTLQVTGQHCRLDTGGGIVADSVANEEYDECLAKARFATALQQGLGLIETMRFDVASGGIPLLSRHLARLAASAGALDFRFERDAMSEALRALCAPLTRDARVRLQLAHDGSFALSHGDIAPLSGPQTIQLAHTPLDGADPRLRHKTTARRFYDDALARATAAGHFDRVFFNREGHLCEGARSNIVVELDGQRYTPPLSCGLLPGVMRAALLDAGWMREGLVRRIDIEQATRIWAINALRGAVPVRLA
ncbi:MAG: aminodeoxychorismate synthase component I [Rhodocyclaceae bacterium]